MEHIQSFDHFMKLMEKTPGCLTGNTAAEVTVSIVCDEFETTLRSSRFFELALNTRRIEMKKFADERVQIWFTF